MFYSQKGKEIYAHQFPDASAVLYPHSIWLGSKIQMDGDAKSQSKIQMISKNTNLPTN